MFKNGDIYVVDFGTNNNNLQSGVRPAIVFQNDIGNKNSPNLIVIPLTSKIKKTNMPTHIYLDAKNCNLKCDSLALCENIQTVSKKQVGKYITTLTESYLSKVSIGVINATALFAHLTNNDLEKLKVCESHRMCA